MTFSAQGLVANVFSLVKVPHAVAVIRTRAHTFPRSWQWLQPSTKSHYVLRVAEPDFVRLRKLSRFRQTCVFQVFKYRRCAVRNSPLALLWPSILTLWGVAASPRL